MRMQTRPSPSTNIESSSPMVVAFIAMPTTERAFGVSATTRASTAGSPTNSTAVSARKLSCAAR
jgi:hypothetical protein